MRPAGAAEVTGRFQFEVACTDGYTDSFELADGETWTSPPLDIGTECTVVETGGPLADGGQWSTTYDPGQTILIGESGLEVRSVVVTNTGVDRRAIALADGIALTLGALLLVVRYMPRRRAS